MDNFVRGYSDDAGVDIVLDDLIEIKPGFSVIELPCHYTPGKGEVAFIVPRSSTAKKGIFNVMVAIDCGYTGILHAFVYNMSEHTQVFDKGERAFGIVNLKLGEDRVTPTIQKQGKRDDSWNASSGK